jgi:hypothetical protein
MTQQAEALKDEVKQLKALVKKLEKLVDESLEDSGYWKREARQAQEKLKVETACLRDALHSWQDYAKREKRSK